MSLADEAREVRERIAARLRELEPLVREYQELQRLAGQMGLEGLDGDLPTVSLGEQGGASGGAPASADRPRSRRRSTGRGSKAPRRTPRADEGQLAPRILAAVRARPGKTVGEYAEVLGVPPTALYRPVRRLATEGALVKRARQLFPE